MRRAFVTGATGFVGAAVARALVSAGWQVRALARPASDRRNLAGLPLEVISGDLRDPASYAAALPDCEALFHVAADYRLWAPHPADLYAVNVEGTRALLEAAGRAGVPCVVYTSSVATLRLAGDGTVADENSIATLADMIGHYKRSKFLAEQVVQEWAAASAPQRRVVIVNPSTPVGPRDVKPTPTGQIVLDAAAGRTPAYVDTGLNVAHVDDIARGHLLALERGRHAERYILGGADLTLREILTQVTRIAGRRPPRIRLPHGVVLPIAYLAEAWARLTSGDTRITVEGVRMARKRMYFSSAKAMRELGYTWRDPALAFEDAVRWFRENGYLPMSP
ncbi:MAG TPA: hopanoid-associated sugar epimerase [Steroidobacteraceae bacterium]|nr:hopanoid-associated sugar epimerase [Steroidobacteraceae bacterium]